MPTPVPPGADPALFAISEEFMRFSYDLLGAHLDGLGGLSAARAELIRHQDDKIARLKHSEPEKASEEFMDQQPMTHELVEVDNRGSKTLLHRTTQGEFKRRTNPDGLDARLLGYMAITLLYGSWEDKYREKLAIALGHSKKRGLKDDLFGDLRKLRNAIVHNHGVATEEVERATVLKWFCRGETILILPMHVHDLLNHIDIYITKLCGIRILDDEPPQA